MKKRASGILLHITSLPSKYGVGDLGPAAYEFADFLSQAGQRYWQVLPVNPPAVEVPHCPYANLSAYAGDPLLISPELLYCDGLLKRREIQHVPDFSKLHTDYRAVIPYKKKLLKLAYSRFKVKAEGEGFEKFCVANSGWLDDFAVFSVLRKHFAPKLWCDWPKEFRDKNKIRQSELPVKMRDAIRMEKFLQYEFFRQWLALKDYCNQRQVRMIGDIPIYVSFDSADVWANREFFKLTNRNRPKVVSGVPPDFFNKTGQLWGHPIYDWRALKRAGYSWWIGRIGHNLLLFDVVRLDHFRAFIAYWQVPAGHRTAAKGRRVRAPKDSFFAKVFGKFGAKSFIAEDLGFITPAAREFVEKSGIAGTRVVQFGFDGDRAMNIHSPENYISNCAAYTSTHDSNTLRGWFETEAGAGQIERLRECVGRKTAGEQMHWKVIRFVMNSKARLVIVAMQDVLGLGSEARMNVPGTVVKTNWTWRLGRGQVDHAVVSRLKKLTRASGRC